ncbi:MAG: hypothetical protein JWL97_2952 [Gemmatimonadales bacterium]|nr:hypothetical protein [Gemmatimonadales bacterium]
MTAALAHTPTRIPFLAKYKAEHELAGQHVERGRFCESCGQRFFAQQVVNPDYYNALRRASREFFLQSCEVSNYPKGIAAWFPKFCHHCTRRTL